MNAFLNALEKTFVAITFAEHGVLLNETPRDEEILLAGQIAELK
ncbi:MAG TPA: hypothetical protein VN604_05750 [Nitrospirota bacterium]|nr:hypothetical protein [Nitrospirota bacterium]